MDNSLGHHTLIIQPTDVLNSFGFSSGGEGVFWVAPNARRSRPDWPVFQLDAEGILLFDNKVILEGPGEVSPYLQKRHEIKLVNASPRDLRVSGGVILKDWHGD